MVWPQQQSTFQIPSCREGSSQLESKAGLAQVAGASRVENHYVDLRPHTNFKPLFRATRFKTCIEENEGHSMLEDSSKSLIF